MVVKAKTFKGQTKSDNGVMKLFKLCKKGEIIRSINKSLYKLSEKKENHLISASYLGLNVRLK